MFPRVPTAHLPALQPVGVAWLGPETGDRFFRGHRRHVYRITFSSLLEKRALGMSLGQGLGFLWADCSCWPRGPFRLRKTRQNRQLPPGDTGPQAPPPPPPTRSCPPSAPLPGSAQPQVLLGLRMSVGHAELRLRRNHIPTLNTSLRV